KEQSGESAGFPLTNTPKHMANGSVLVHPSDRLNGWLRAEDRSQQARRTTAAPDAAHQALSDIRADRHILLEGSDDLDRSGTLDAGRGPEQAGSPDDGGSGPRLRGFARLPGLQPLPPGRLIRPGPGRDAERHDLQPPEQGLPPLRGVSGRAHAAEPRGYRVHER